MSEIIHSDRQTWLEWRWHGLGSSDAAAVMGVSKWSDPEKLLIEKTNPPVESVSNFAIDRGNELEPIARRKFAALYNFEQDTDETFDPYCLEMAELPFMRASLDGRSKDGTKIIEIKYQGKEPHEAARRGLVPAYYFPQLQQGLLVSGAEVCFFISINKQKEIVYVQVGRDEEYMAQLVRESGLFWAKVLAARASPKEVETDVDQAFEEIAKLDQILKETKAKKDALEDLLFEKANGEKLSGQFFEVRQETRKGSIDYSKIEELKGVDLEKYRKSSSTYPRIYAKKC